MRQIKKSKLKNISNLLCWQNSNIQKRLKFTKPQLIDVTRNVDILHDPLLNKGTGFKIEERERFGLRGLVPPSFFSFEQQVKKLRARFHEEKEPLNKYRMFETLFQKKNQK